MPRYRRQGRIGRWGVSCVAAILAFACVELGGTDESKTISPVSQSISANLEVRVLYDQARANDIASQVSALGERVPGGPEESGTAELIAERFRSLGLQVSVESFPVVYFVEHNSVIRIAGNHPTELTATAAWHSPPGVITAKVVDCGLGETAEEFPFDVVGNIALIRSSGTSTEAQVMSAYEAGAAAVILTTRLREPVASDSPILKLPTAIVSANDAAALRTLLSRGHVRTATVEIDTVCEPSISRNVIGAIPSSAAGDEVLYVGTHYDSPPASLEVSDNTASIGILLESARFMASGLRPKAAVKYVAFGANAVGQLGARVYVREHEAEIRQKAIGMLNIDGSMAVAQTVVSPGKNSSWLVSRMFTAAQASRLPLPRIVPETLGDQLPFELVSVPTLVFQHRVESSAKTPDIHVGVFSSDESDSRAVMPVGELVTAVVDALSRNPPVRSGQRLAASTVTLVRSCPDDTCGVQSGRPLVTAQ